MVAPGKKKSSVPGKKKSSTRDGETSNSSNPTFEDVELFLKFLVSNGLKHKAAWKKINYIRLAMPWRDDTNKVDCGVFAMRHMETYMGETVRSWRCGLAKDKPKMLKYMRVKYCAAILGSDINILRDQVLAASKEYYELKSKAEVVGVDELLTVYE
ncbi:hypothetical protein CASFOL_023396 [Castilleja foliolosa]|uniref:Ubiquitin-like protease family profile domain-containing protein n=1 Tax=Castilleja foliolosa TaxID=1961234 RepID=A0ABD3C4D8_9LAMI